MLCVLGVILGACGGASEPEDFCDAVEDAEGDAFVVVRNENWIGPDNPVVIKAGKLTRDEGDTVFAARVLVTNALDQVMFLWTDSETFGDAPLLGDGPTRLFTTASIEIAPGSPEDDQVKEARSSPEGQAVILYAENQC